MLAAWGWHEGAIQLRLLARTRARGVTPDTLRARAVRVNQRLAQSPTDRSPTPPARLQATGGSMQVSRCQLTCHMSYQCIKTSSVQQETAPARVAVPSSQALVPQKALQHGQRLSLGERGAWVGSEVCECAYAEERHRGMNRDTSMAATAQRVA